jgi:hypothetical protein
VYQIDHLCIGVQNLREDAVRLREEIGIGWYDSGEFPFMGVGQHNMVPGRDTYIEIEAINNPEVASDHFFGRWFAAATEKQPECFIGWIVRVDTLDELNEAAERLGVTATKVWTRVLPDGRRLGDTLLAPGMNQHAWPRGLPLFQYWPDMDAHPGNIDLARNVEHVDGVKPNGFAWLELGGEEETRAWLGPKGDSLPIRYVDGPPGLRAVGIANENGEEIVIRKPPLDVSLASVYTPPADWDE